MRLFGLPLLALSSWLAIACQLADAATRPQYGGTLHVTTRLAPNSLDPADPSQPDSLARRNLTALMFDTLVVTDQQGRLQPALALSWQADPGNQRWKFMLRRDVKFHDGSPLTPDRVAASLRVANPGWKIFSDSDSVVIERDAPAPELAADLSRPRNAIAKRETNSAVGTGPFRVGSFTPGRHLALAANEDSWSGRPYLDAIDIDLGKNARDQLLGLELGRADVAELSPEQAARVAGSRRVISSQPVELVTLLFTRDPQTPEDRALRSALALSIDRASIRHVVLQSSGEPTAALLPNWVSGYAFVFPIAQNLALTRQKRSELRQAPTLTFAYDSSDPFTQVMAERIMLNAKDAGLTIQTTSSATPDFRLLRITLDSADPRLALSAISDQLGLAPARPANTSTDALCQAENTALQSQRVIPLFYLPASYGLGPNVRGWSETLTGTPQLANVWLGAPAP